MRFHRNSLAATAHHMRSALASWDRNRFTLNYSVIADWKESADTLWLQLSLQTLLTLSLTLLSGVAGDKHVGWFYVVSHLAQISLAFESIFGTSGIPDIELGSEMVSSYLPIGLESQKFGKLVELVALAGLWLDGGLIYRLGIWLVEYPFSQGNPLLVSVAW